MLEKNHRAHVVDRYLESSSVMDNLSFEMQYAISLKNILYNGNLSGDRTGTGTLRIQGQKFVLDVSGNKIPALRAKKIFNEKILAESLWMFMGKTDLEFLHKYGVNYWNDWADENGQLGPIYGTQMRDFNGIDQLSKLIDTIKTNPDSRRIIVSLWNPNDLPKMSLEPCHVLYQICVYKDKKGVKKMDMHVTQRSADSFLGVPYDFILFTGMFRMISQVVDIPVNKIHYTCNDYHMYLNHKDAVNKYLENFYENKNGIIDNDTFMTMEKVEKNIKLDDYLKSMDDNLMKNINIVDYESYPHIKAKIAV